jgi:hypothetical protein
VMHYEQPQAHEFNHITQSYRPPRTRMQRRN